MSTANKIIRVTLHGTLVDFLTTGNTENLTTLELAFKLNPAIKDILEARGIPHTAIFKLEHMGREITLDYNVKSGDQIEVYPFEMADTSKFDRVFSSPGSFIVDTHLNKLASNLRLLGLDTLILTGERDIEIINRSNEEKRMILTRNKNLLKHGTCRYGYWVRSVEPDRQLEEIFKRFELSQKVHPFSRCMVCNGLLKDVPEENVAAQVPPKVKEWCHEFRQCESCHKIYWKGSHFTKLEDKVEHLMRNFTN